MADEEPQVGRKRKGRGTLSTIDRLPEEAEPDVLWANEQLRLNKLPQTVILEEFNERLADRGLPPISKGAFSRYSVRRAIELRKQAAYQNATGAVMSKMTPGERSDATIAAAEMFKIRLFEFMANQDKLDPDTINVASLALQRLSATALRETHGQRLDRKEQREADRAARETAQKIEAIAEEAATAADPAEVLKRIREDVYGIFEK